MCNLTKVFGSHDLYRMLIFSPALLILTPSAPNSNDFKNGKKKRKEKENMFLFT